MEHIIETEIYGHRLQLVTDKKCFSPHNIDRGTIELLKAVSPEPGQKIMDLGCGYGVVGIACGKITGPGNITMVDINPVAVSCARKNAELNFPDAAQMIILTGDGPGYVDGADFDLILSNPPYHTDYAVAKGFIEKGFKKLKTGGRMIMVVKKPNWYKNKLTGIFGGVRWLESEGYTVLTAEKKPYRPKEKTKTVPKKHAKKQERKKQGMEKQGKERHNGNDKKQ